jgi:hypothetical protein
MANGNPPDSITPELALGGLQPPILSGNWPHRTEGEGHKLRHLKQGNPGERVRRLPTLEQVKDRRKAVTLFPSSEFLGIVMNVG